MEQQVEIGSVSDSMEKLTKLCHEKAEQLTKTMIIENDVMVTFWTEDIPELICIATFSKNTNGNITYNLDFSQSTL